MLNEARAKVKSGLANLSFFMAQGGGILASVSMIGGWLIHIASIGPWYAPLVWFSVSVILCVGDWAEEGIPNRRAVATAMMWPSFLIASLTGACGAKLFAAIGAIDKSTAADMKSGIKDWTTHLPSSLKDAFTVFSVILIVMAATWAQQYAKKSKAAAAAAAGGPAATTRPVARRGGR